MTDDKGRDVCPVCGGGALDHAIIWGKILWCEEPSK